jgi:PKD repeat protein
MKRNHVLYYLCLMALLLPLVNASTAPPGPSEFSPVQNGFVTDGQTVLPYAPDRVLVKFTQDGYAKSRLNIQIQRVTPDAEQMTGIPSVDALSREVGVVQLTRAYDQPKNRIEAARLGVERWFKVEVPANSDIPDVASRFAADPNIEYASPDWRAFPDVVPTDPLYPDHWGHNNTAQLPSYDWNTYSHTGPLVGTVGFDCNAQAAWDGSQGFGSSDIIIAILDSGVDIDHPDLDLVSGYDFGDNDPNPDDDSAQPGHGTACAGVAASLANNGIGACGAAPGTRIMPCKVADSSGGLYFSYIQSALYWAADNGADVISMSFSANITSDPATDAALEYAYNAGVVLLAANSNYNESHIRYPANHINVIGVGAASPCGDRKRSSSNPFECNPGVQTDPNGYTCDGERWWGSNYGNTTPDAAGAVDVIAPTIVPTTDIQGSGGYDPGDYSMFFNGTSCSTPYAAGVCGLIKSKNPTWTNAQIRDQLVTTAIDIVNVESGSGWDRYSGYGMVDAEAAVGGGCDITADFTADQATGCASLTVNFTDQSTGTGIDGWSWDFGDGVGTSTAQNPSYKYDTPGVYTVTLIASSSGQGCSDTEAKVDFVTVNGPPVAEFSGSPLSGPASLTVNFTDLSTGNPTTWSWDFGDGVGTSTQQNPSYTYDTPGLYTVELAVTSACGSDVETKIDYIDVTEPGQTEKAYAGSEVTTYGTVSGGYTNTFASDNVYEVLTEALSTGHPVKVTSQLEHRWTLNVPSGTNPTFYLEAYRTNNTDGDNFVFEYSTDGAAYNGLLTLASATEQVYSVGLPAGTSGTVYVRVTDTNRSWGNTSLDAVYVDEMYIEVETTPGPPVADFTADDTSGDAPHTVNFTDLSTGNPTSWDWDFGDGVGTSTEKNPSYTYNDVGTYTVTLTATNAYGSDTEQKVDYITVTEPGVNQLHVYAITVTRKTAGPNNNGIANVTIHDQDNNPIANAVVYGFFNEPNTNTKTGTTGADGVAVINGDKTKAGVLDFCFEVTDVVLSGYDYNSAANRMTAACESGPVQVAGPIQSSASEDRLPANYELGQNYPNPFNPVTSISFALPREATVRIDVFSVNGELITTLLNESRNEGYHVVEWNAAGAASGIYFYRLTAGDFTMTRKMILMK